VTPNPHEWRGFVGGQRSDPTHLTAVLAKLAPEPGKVTRVTARG
jgi:hypothetical protein